MKSSPGVAALLLEVRQLARFLNAGLDGRQRLLAVELDTLRALELDGHGPCIVGFVQHVDDGRKVDYAMVSTCTSPLVPRSGWVSRPMMTPCSFAMSPAARRRA